MKNRCGYLSIIVALFFALSAFAQDGKLVVAKATSKELKRTAHRLRIPVEQLKNARKALQEVTDLARRTDPYPVDQLYSIVQNWAGLNRPKAREVVDSFIQDLRSRAAGASDMGSYQRATSAAMTIAQSMDDYQKVQELLQNWPEPQKDFNNISANMMKDLRSSIENQSLYRLINEDPEKALEVLSKSGDTSNYRYSMYGQVAQGLMNAGKKEAAVDVIEQTISNFSQHADDPRALQEYENFIRMVAYNMDSSRAATAVNQWITQIMKQPPSPGCGGNLKSGDNSVDLSCSEFKALNFLRGMSMKPGMVMKTLDAVPELRSKLDDIGGVDNLYSGSNLSYSPPAGMQPIGPAVKAGLTTTPENPSALVQQLRGKLDSNPSLVKRKLQEAAKGPEGISFLIALASMASYQDPELSSLALEIAQPLLPQVEPLSKRASTLRNLVQGYRQVDGSVDTGLLKDGFILADQLREEAASAKIDQVTNPAMQAPRSWEADQLETFLVAELSRDSFEDAMRYARSIENATFKLQCMNQIVQALRSSY